MGIKDAADIVVTSELPCSIPGKLRFRHQSLPITCRKVVFRMHEYDLKMSDADLTKNENV